MASAEVTAELCALLVKNELNEGKAASVVGYLQDEVGVESLNDFKRMQVEDLKEVREALKLNLIELRKIEAALLEAQKGKDAAAAAPTGGGGIDVAPAAESAWGVVGPGEPQAPTPSAGTAPCEPRGGGAVGGGGTASDQGGPGIGGPLELKRKRTPMQPVVACYPPLEPGVVRLHHAYHGHAPRDLQPEDGRPVTMKYAYAELQKEWPGALLVRYPAGDLAVLREDPVPENRELLILPCASVPIVLPTELRVHCGGEAKERDVAFAQVKEVLCELLKPHAYGCHKDADSDMYVFLHCSKRPSRDHLIPVPGGVRALDKVIRKRKVSFLAAVGKPRDGKSTLLALIERHYANARGVGIQGPIPFRCSDSATRCCTAGLWVSLRELTQCPLKPGNSQLDQDSVVLLLDSEGLFADDGNSKEYFVRIFTTVAMLSSCLIFNNKVTNIKVEEFKMPIARLAALFQGFYEKNKWIREHRPKLIYLARDWNDKQDDVTDDSMWEEAEFAGQGDDPLKFVREVFGQVKFRTLPTPVGGVSKLNVTEQQLLPGFEDKLGHIIKGTITPFLTPKSFMDGDSKMEQAIRGSAPLLDLIESIVKAVNTEADDSWGEINFAHIRKSFVERAVLSQVPHKAQELAEELELRFSHIPSLSLGLMSLAKSQGLGAADTGRGVKDKPAALRGFLAANEGDILKGLQEETVRMPNDIEIFHQLFNDRHKEYADQLYLSLSKFGHQRETVEAMFAKEVLTVTEDIVECVERMIHVRVAAEMDKVHQRLAERLKEGESEDDLKRRLLQAQEEVKKLPKRFPDNRLVEELVASRLPEFEELLTRILEHPRKVLERCAHALCVQALGQGGMPLDLALKQCSGRPLFATKIDVKAVLPEGLALLGGSEEGAFVRTMPLKRRQEVVDLLEGICNDVNLQLAMEQECRLYAEIRRFFRPLCRGDLDHCAAKAARSILAGGSQDTRVAIAENLILQLQAAVENTSEGRDCLTQVVEALTKEGPSHAVLGEEWAGRLGHYMKLACELLSRSAADDFQVLLQGNGKSGVEDVLSKVDVQFVAVDAYISPWFRITLPSSLELAKFLERRGENYLPFQDFGLKVPPLVWVVQNPSQEVRQDIQTEWKDHVVPSIDSRGELLLEPSFESAVASLFPGQNDFRVKKSRVQVRARQCILLYPVEGTLTAGDVADALGDIHVQHIAKMDKTTVVIADIPRTMQDLFLAQQSVEMRSSRLEERLLRFDGQLTLRAVPEPNCEFLYVKRPTKQLLADWDIILKNILSQVQTRLAGEIRANPGKECTEAAILQHLRQATKDAGVAHAVEVDALKRLSQELGFVVLDLLASKLAAQLCDAIDVEPSLASVAVPPSEMHARVQGRDGGESAETLLLRLSLEPVVQKLEGVVAGLDNTRLSWALTKLGQLASEGKIPAELLERLRKCTEGRQSRIESQVYLKEVAALLGLPDYENCPCPKQVAQIAEQLAVCPGEAEEARAVQKIFELSFIFNGRRCVPQALLERAGERTRKFLAQVLAKYEGTCCCRLSPSYEPNLERILSKDEVVARRSFTNAIEFLLTERSDFVKRLVERSPVGCDVMQQLTCHLRRKGPAEDAFDCLDSARMSGAFVTELRDGEDGFAELKLLIWVEDFRRLKIPDFDIKHMKTVMLGARQPCPREAALLSSAEAVLYARDFGTKEVQVPEHLAQYARDLCPMDYKPLPFVPSADLDGEELVRDFNFLQHVSPYAAAALEGKEWKAEVCQQHFARFKGDRDLEQPLRVYVMCHTRALCSKGKYYIGNKEVGLQMPQRQSTLHPLPQTPTLSRPCRSTEIKVTALDSIAAALECRTMDPRSTVLVLNMANRNNPGGGYSKGSLAQEEDLFRRTTLSSALVQEYCSALTAARATAARTARAPWQEQPGVWPPRYPLGEFEPVITSGVMAFRGPEEAGYPLMDAPFLFDVVSMAAYNANKKAGGQSEGFEVTSGKGEAASFTPEGFWRTAVNITALLAAAAEHKTDHLVLSALGCGAFQNPAAEVAGLFRQLLPDFAGCFKTVVFAIKGSGSDPNFLAFKSAIDFHILPSPKDLPAILPPRGLCPLLAKCDQVSCGMWHPPWCSNPGCSDTSAAHQRLRRHRSECCEPNCEIMFGPDSERKQEHASRYTHKPVCTAEHCTDSGHLHPRPCKNGPKCEHIGKPHPNGYWYSHKQQPCPHGTFCPLWQNSDHRSTFVHPFVTPCDEAAFCLHRDSVQHTKAVAHLCPWGSECKELGSSTHTRNWIHLRRPPCPHGAVCRATECANYEDHLEMFQHPKMKFCRPLCRDVHCKQISKKHLQEAAHAVSDATLPICQVWGHNVVQKLMLPNQEFCHVDFEDNAEHLIQRVQAHFKHDRPQEAVLLAAENLLRQFRPVHRISRKNFALVLLTGFLASMHCLETHSRHEEFALQLPVVTKALQDHPDCAKQVTDAISALFQLAAVETGAQTGSEDQTSGQGGQHAEKHRLQSKVARALDELKSIGIVETLQQEVKNFIASIHDLEKRAKSLEQGEQLAGIGYHKDRIFETNKMVFAILGPHRHWPYSKDEDDEKCEGVHLVFEQKSLQHPDFYLTPIAATFYESQADGKLPLQRPWWKPCDGSPNEMMCREKLHPAAPKCFKALAWDFLGRAALLYKKSLASVTVQDMLKCWMEVDAHFVVECHMPYVTPLTLVEKVVLSEHTFKKLSAEEQVRARTVFKPQQLTEVKGLPADTKHNGPVAKEQYKCAQAPLAHPPLPPCFAFTLLSRNSQAVLPWKLPRKCTVFFRAFGRRFKVILCTGISSTEVPENPHTFEVDGACCRFSSRSEGAPTEQCATFNRGLSPESRAIMYQLDVDTAKGMLTLKHAGASRALNSQEVVFSRASSAFPFLLFVNDGLVHFTDVRVHSCDTSSLLEHERFSQSTVEVSVEERVVQVPFQEARSRGGMDWMWGWMRGGGRPNFCPDGLRCVAAYQTKSENRTREQQEHLKQVQHLCLYGSSCRDREKTEHNQYWGHLDKPICDAAECPSLCEPYHRAEFHHPGKWDVLLPCKGGDRCMNATTLQHCLLFHHTKVSASLANGMLELGLDEGGSGVPPPPPPPPPSAPSSQLPPPTTWRPQEAQAHHQTWQPSVSQPVSAGGFGATGSNGYGGSAAAAAATEVDIDQALAETADVEDEVVDVYQQGAIQRNFAGAELDEYGNPKGGAFDLAKDGAMKGYGVLVGCFYRALRGDLDAYTIPELRKKGFAVEVVLDVDSFTAKLNKGKYHVAWIISDQSFVGDKQAFLREVKAFHNAGRGLMVWGDNDPFYAHANEILGPLFSFQLTGNTLGCKELTLGNPRVAGHFGPSSDDPKNVGRLICAGVSKLHEGETICFPNRVQPGWSVFGTSSDNNPVLLAKDVDSRKTGPGRVVVDNGFTKLMKGCWTTAGTPRYVSNCTVWLVWWERFRCSGWGFKQYDSPQ